MLTSKFYKTAAVALMAGCISLNTIAQDIYSKKAITQNMQRVFTWQLAHPLKVNLAEDWARAVLYVGAMRTYNSVHNELYLDGSTKYADSVHWVAGKRPRHADDLVRGQVFLDIFALKKQPYMIAGIKKRVDSLIETAKPGRVDWWWCDALFMEPPVLARLAQQTGDRKYITYLDNMWWDATAFLFDKSEDLYFRDKSYFNQLTPSGKKVFWSRGNGWVMAGLAQVIERLPKNDTSRAAYVELYKKMAAKIAGLQQADGFWRASLLDAAQVPVKETSGTGFYTFALAWGINQKILDKQVYLPVVKRGWDALNSAIDTEGKLQWVQQIGAKPDAVKQSDNQEYGTGAYLMAATELLKLKI